MRVKHTALLTGPYDWDPALVPLAEFEARLDRVRSVLAKRGAKALIVHGHSAEHGSLAYFTGFTPKLGPALALIPGEGGIRLLVSGGKGMLGSAKKLTWIEDMRPLGEPGRDLTEWIRNMAAGENSGPIGLCGVDGMGYGLHQDVRAALRPFGQIIEMDRSIDSLRRYKSPCERGLLRKASEVLAAACDHAASATLQGAGVRSALLIAERRAFERGAQDFRTLASARGGGPPLRFDNTDDIHADPLLANIAIRYAGYWSEGSLTISAKSHPLYRHIHATLLAAIEKVRADAPFQELADIASREQALYHHGRITVKLTGNAVGLSLEEAPHFGEGVNAVFEENGVYVLRSHIEDTSGAHAIGSAMFAVTKEGADLYWSSPETAHSASRASQVTSR